MKLAAAPPDIHGTLTKFFAAPEDFIYKIPSTMSLQEAVVLEPLAVAVHAISLLAVCPGQTVVITGAGTVGQLCAQVAQEPGAGRVILADIVGRKLEMAAQGLGCDTFLINPVETPEQSFERLSVAMNIGDGVDAVVEASGAEKPVQIGNYTVKRGGTYVQIGVGKPKATIPILALLEKELLVRGSHSFVRE